MSLSLIYSSNSKVILSLSNMVEFKGGFALIRTGGILSLLPPVGIPLLAHWETESARRIPNIKTKCFCMKVILNAN